MANDTFTDAQIAHMVGRFLAWKLPENFNPDGGVSFKRTFNENILAALLSAEIAREDGNG